MPTDPLVRKLIRAAKQRLTSSDVLLKNGQFIDSMYLAGYGVECALKALLMSRLPPGKRRQTEEQVFRGKSGHDFENLKARIRKCGVAFPKAITNHLQIVSTWSTDLRYEVGVGPGDDAQAFGDAAIAIVKWVEDQL
jgi:hypothetical protein